MSIGHNMKAFLILVLGCSSLLGQGRGRSVPAAGTTPPPVLAEAAPLNPEDRCIIEGTVSNAMSGEPLRKVNLTLRRVDGGRAGMPGGPGGPGGMSYTATTDAAGRFVISGIEPGKYRLQAEKAGFVDQQYGAKGPSRAGETIELAKSQRMRDASLKMTPHGVISGRVLDEEGEPVVNATLQVVRRGYVRGRKQMVPVDSGSTNDLGEYRVYGLSPGRYYLSALYRRGSRGMPTQEGDQETYAPTYYPGGSTPDSAAPVDLQPGAHFGNMDIRLQKMRAVRVQGRVMVAQASGNRPAIATIMLMQKGEPSQFGMRNTTRPYNAQGDFIINNVSPGSYIAVATHFENGQLLSARQPVEVGNSPVDGITLTPVPGAELRGRVKVEGEASADMGRIRVSLSPRSSAGAMFGPGAQGSGTVKADGTFSMLNVQAELYDVRVSGVPDGGYVKSIRMGNADITDTGLDFSTGVTPAEVAIVISLAAGAVDGTVQSEKPEQAAGATVVLVPEGSRSESDRYYVTASSDQNGRFTLKNVTPGEYRLYAFDTVESGAYMDPEWRKPYEGKGERVSVRESGREMVQPRLVITQVQ